MGKLEDFIRGNREDLDDQYPSPETWEGIRRELVRRNPGILKRMAAAAVIIVVATAAIFHYAIDKRDDAMNNREAILKNNPQLKETELYYSNLVNSLYNEVSPMLAGYPDIKKEFLKDMSQIDSICTDIKKDLKDNVSNQEVIEALINNYRIKIQILEEMLAQLKQNESKTVKNDSHEL